VFASSLVMSIRTAGAIGRKAVIVTWPSELVELYEGSYRPMVRVAYALLGSRQEAEEVVHDAVVALARHWGTVDHPSVYFRRSVVNGCYGVLRRREVAGRYVPGPPPDDQERSLIELRDVLLALPWRHVRGHEGSCLYVCLGVVSRCG